MSFIDIIHQPDIKSNTLSSLQQNHLTALRYKVLTLEELAVQIDREHQQCQRQAIALGLLYARNAGDYLLQAIALVETEQWSSWLTDHCHLSEKTATTYIQIARGWPSLSRLAQDPANQATVLPGVKDNSEHPDLSLPDAKGEINPPIAVNNEAVLNPLDVNHSAAEFPPGDRPVKESETHGAKKTKTESDPTIYSFWIPGKVTPKARPRVTNNGTFFPKRYREWRLKAQGEIIMQVQQMTPPPKLPIQEAALRILLCGNHRGDGDNAIGSVCDALVSAGVLPSDSLKYLPYGSWRHIKSAETGVKIEIKPLC